jgi:hypothetical protein
MNSNIVSTRYLAESTTEALEQCSQTGPQMLDTRLVPNLIHAYCMAHE